MMTVCGRYPEVVEEWCLKFDGVCPPKDSAHSLRNSLGDCPHWRKVIENWINAAVLLCFIK